MRSETAQLPAVFLDRDGVIVVPEFRDGRSFAPTQIEQFQIYSSAAEHLHRLKNAGYRIVVVTNQPDIGRGIIPVAIVDEMHRRLCEELPIDLIKVCAHTTADGCKCRKPKPGMLLEAAAELGIDLSRSFMVGDRKSDVEAGRAAGCRTVFIDLGYTEPRPCDMDVTVRSIKEAADAILQENEWKMEPRA